jgi:hypothetical protein
MSPMRTVGASLCSEAPDVADADRRRVCEGFGPLATLARARWNERPRSYGRPRGQTVPSSAARVEHKGTFGVARGLYTYVRHWGDWAVSGG